MGDYKEPMCETEPRPNLPEPSMDNRSFNDRVVQLRDTLHMVANISLCIRENQKKAVRNLIDSGIGGVLNIIDNGNYTLVEHTTEAFGGEDIPVDIELSDLATEFYTAINT